MPRAGDRKRSSSRSVSPRQQTVKRGAPPSSSSKRSRSSDAESVNSADSFDTASTAGLRTRIEPKLLDAAPLPFVFVPIEPPKDPPHANVRVERPEFLPGTGPGQQMNFDLPLPLPPKPPPFVPLEREKDNNNKDMDVDGNSDGASTLTGYSTKVPTAPPAADVKDKEKDDTLNQKSGVSSQKLIFESVFSANFLFFIYFGVFVKQRCNTGLRWRAASCENTRHTWGLITYV